MHGACLYEHASKIDVHRVKIYWLSGKEKFPGVTVNKEDYADSILRYERIHHNWFLWKDVTINCVSYCQLFRRYFILFIEKIWNDHFINIVSEMNAIQKQVHQSLSGNIKKKL